MMIFTRTLWLTICCLLNAASSPFLYHVERFPFDRHDIHDLCIFNRSYKIKVGSIRDFHPDSFVVTEIEKECDLLWTAWDALDDAKNVMFNEIKRRAALGKLLKIIGPEAFVRGEMPPHVPYWRFTEVRQ
jgi:hypothetical protein